MKLPILYIKPGCPWCEDALSYFKAKNLNLDIVNVLLDTSKMDELVSISGQSKTPTLANGNFVVADFDLAEFEDALEKNPEEKKKLGI